MRPEIHPGWQKDAPDLVLYHLTSLQNLPDIARGGLDPARSRAPAFRARSVYFASDTHHALGYHGHHGSDTADQAAVLLSVPASSLDPGELYPDDVDLPDLLGQNDDARDLADLDWLESLKISGQCAYTAVVPATALTVVFFRPMARAALVPMGQPLLDWKMKARKAIRRDSLGVIAV